MPASQLLEGERCVFYNIFAPKDEQMTHIYPLLTNLHIS